MGEPVLRMRGIKKAFPGVRAVDWDPDDELTVAPGEMRALAGENGAGKSTLVQILAGIHPMDAGEIHLDGQPFQPGPHVRTQPGLIGIILQEPGLIPTLTVADNLFIGRESLYRQGGILNMRLRDRLARDILAQVELDISPRTIVSSLSLEEQKLVELARALSLNPRVLVVDETSAALSLKAVQHLFALLKKAQGEGKAILFISHHLEEIFQYCDSVTVLKDGRLVTTLPVGETNPDHLSTLMVGREVLVPVRERPSDTEQAEEPGPEAPDQEARDPAGDQTRRVPVLSVKGLTVPGVFEDVSFDVYPGEIVGIGGLVGAGGNEIGRALFGDLPVTVGRIQLDGRELNIRNPQAAVKAGIGYVPKERDKEGLILRFNITQNVTLPRLASFLTPFRFISRRKEQQAAREQIRDLGIRCRGERDICLHLSGGNRQKVVLSKWLTEPPRLLILCSPTRGVDVGAKGEIYRIIYSIADQGTAILLITDDLPELIGLSDRILIMRRARISAHLHRDDEPTEQRLIQYMV